MCNKTSGSIVQVLPIRATAAEIAATKKRRKKGIALTCLFFLFFWTYMYIFF